MRMIGSKPSLAWELSKTAEVCKSARLHEPFKRPRVLVYSFGDETYRKVRLSLPKFELDSRAGMEADTPSGRAGVERALVGVALLVLQSAQIYPEFIVTYTCAA